MAFTKVLPAGISSATNLVIDSINSAGVVTATGIVASTGTFSGNVSIAGTLTYEDATNVDSVGLITARSGIHVTGGSVGIGTDNPAAELEVYGNARFKDTDGSHGIEFYPDVASLGYQRIISYNRTSTAYEDLSIGVNDFVVTTGSSSERLRITSSGNIGIGTDNPDEKFEVYGGKIKVDGGGNRWITIDPGSNTTYEPRVEGSHELVFRSYVASGSGVKTCTFTSNGDLDLTQGRNLKFASGNGIDFSATGGPDTGTGSSELLDDYEEGTYSPAWQHATNVNYTSQNGQYIKIGRLVRVSGEFSFTTYTSFPNGWDQITLPFNGTRLNSSGSVSSDWWAVVAGGTGQSAGTLNFGPFGNPHNDTNLAFTNIFLTGNNGMGNAVLGSIFTSSSDTKTIRFHITYTATS